MSWKQSNDGGLDFDVTQDIKYKKTKEKIFNSSATAHTYSYNFNAENANFDEKFKSNLKNRIKQRIRERGLIPR